MKAQMIVQLTVDDLQAIIRESVRSELNNSRELPVEPTYLSRKQVLEITGVSAPVISQRVSAGILKPLKCGREHRYKLSELKLAFPESFID